MLWKMILTLLARITVVPMLVIVFSILISFSILENMNRFTTDAALSIRLGVDIEFFAASMLLSAFFIFVRYIILNKKIVGLEKLFYAVSMLPLSYYALLTGIYQLITLATKTTGLLTLALWGFLLLEPIVRRNNHE